MTPFEEFTARLMRLYWEHDCCDIDGGDLQEMAIKAGIAVERPVTQDDLERSDIMMQWGMKPGDPWVLASPELMALMEKLK